MKTTIIEKKGKFYLYDKSYNTIYINSSEKNTLKIAINLEEEKFISELEYQTLTLSDPTIEIINMQ